MKLLLFILLRFINIMIFAIILVLKNITEYFINIDYKNLITSNNKIKLNDKIKNNKYICYTIIVSEK
jgi:hypothetical protein